MVWKNSEIVGNHSCGLPYICFLKNNEYNSINNQKKLTLLEQRFCLELVVTTNTFFSILQYSNSPFSFRITKRWWMWTQRHLIVRVHQLFESIYRHRQFPTKRYRPSSSPPKCAYVGGLQFQLLLIHSSLFSVSNQPIVFIITHYFQFLFLLETIHRLYHYSFFFSF